jgi:alpha-N-acetylglucosamine transferase
MPEKGRRAYVTLCANADFLPGARCLARSLARTATPWPLVCIVPAELEAVARIELGKERLEILPIQPLALSPQFVARHANGAIESVTPMARGSKPVFHSRFLNFLKLRAWEFIEFEKIVFLDADTVVIRNIDRLFEYPGFSAAPNLYESLVDFHRINSGVMVLEPCRQTFSKMLSKLDAPGAYWPRTDQTFLESFFKRNDMPPLGLPYYFNTLQYLWFNLPDLWHWPTVHVVHYQFEKPWDESTFEVSEKSRIRRRLLAPLVDLWHAADTDSCLTSSLMRDSQTYLKDFRRELCALRAMDTSPSPLRPRIAPPSVGRRLNFRSLAAQ